MEGTCWVPRTYSQLRQRLNSPSRRWRPDGARIHRSASLSANSVNRRRGSGSVCGVTLFGERSRTENSLRDADPAIGARRRRRRRQYKVIVEQLRKLKGTCEDAGLIMEECNSQSSACLPEGIDQDIPCRLAAPAGSALPAWCRVRFQPGVIAAHGRPPHQSTFAEIARLRRSRDPESIAATTDAATTSPRSRAPR